LLPDIALKIDSCGCGAKQVKQLDGKR